MNNNDSLNIWRLTFLLVSVAILWFASHLILLLFAGLLVALILSSLVNLLRHLHPLGQKTGLILVVLIIAGALSGVGFLTAAPISQQFSELAERIPKLISDLNMRVQNSPSFQKIGGALPDWQELAPSGGLGRMASFFSSTFDAATSLTFILFAALFLAASPGAYKQILIKLIPPKHRPQGRSTLTKTICVLKYWIIGQVVSMAIVGIVTGVALAVAGVPLALALGILAGLAEFIPIVGPILAAIPALLLALSLGLNKFLIVLAIFFTIQLLEGNVIMPVVQRKAIDLPPVITLAALFLLGGSFGLLGLFVAAPLSAVLLVIIDDLYLRRYLGTEDQLLDNA